MLSDDTLRFFESLISMVQLNAGQPDFEEAARVTARAKRELAEEIASRAESAANTDEPVP